MADSTSKARSLMNRDSSWLRASASGLGDASVPFPYDVHALFFSGDAITIENELHKAFADRRVNFMLGTLHRMGCSRCSGRRSGTLRRGARRAARSSA
jgi:hypothetical protein